MNARSQDAVARSREPNAARRAKARHDRANPWRTYAGIWRENPQFDAFLKEVEAIRREASEIEKKP
jgi:hypothetical protein